MTVADTPWLHPNLLDSTILDSIWADPRLVYTVAAMAVASLGFTIWLFRRRGRGGRQAGMICLVLSIALHAALILLVPMLPSLGGGSSKPDPDSTENVGTESISFTTFDPNQLAKDSAGRDSPIMAPLPVSNLTDLLSDPIVEANPEKESDDSQVDAIVTTGDDVDHEPFDEPESAEPAPLSVADTPVPSALSQPEEDALARSVATLESSMGDFFDDAFADQPVATENETSMPVSENVATDDSKASEGDTAQPTRVSASDASSVPATTRTDQAPSAPVPGAVESDFANRVGKAKDEALHRTGGDATTEAAVEAALRFLASAQRADGAWDPRTTGAGTERAPLGMNRPGAGTKAESALTGLALLAIIGAGQTHQQGRYSDNAYRGLAYLIQNQQSDGSLAGRSTIYAANYCHGIASLAMCETAAITHDPSAVASATRAVNFTRSMQHPSTGGWRYTAGDPGDMSQLGWQAMVLDAGYRAGIPVDARAVSGVERFLRSVRAGSAGGMACYRAGEAPSRTMTAEALATRLLIGQKVSIAEIDEAERYLLQQLPGVGQDNYYYWYYATLALHQLQDPAWEQWNAALKRRLLATQQADGSWPTNSVWGGYGGSVYTTAMAALCLEAYYRHSLRIDADRIARLK